MSLSNRTLLCENERTRRKNKTEEKDDEEEEERKEAYLLVLALLVMRVHSYSTPEGRGVEFDNFAQGGRWECTQSTQSQGCREVWGCCYDLGRGRIHPYMITRDEEGVVLQ